MLSGDGRETAREGVDAQTIRNDLRAVNAPNSIPAVAERLLTENPELVNRLIQRWIGDASRFAGV